MIPCFGVAQRNLRRLRVCIMVKIDKDISNFIVFLVLCLRIPFFVSSWNKSGLAFKLGTNRVPLYPFGSDIATHKFESTFGSCSSKTRKKHRHKILFTLLEVWMSFVVLKIMNSLFPNVIKLPQVT